jgi:signal transduction histidine kinase
VARRSIELPKGLAPVARYGFAMICVAIALGIALPLERAGFREVELPLFALAIVLTAWFAGVGPSVLAVLLSCACNTYYFSEPRYSFEVTAEDLPSFVLFAIWAVIVALFVNVRRRIEADLRVARDHLQLAVEQRKYREIEIRRLNQELAKRAGDLEASNKELESFAYSVSHDLRAPLRHSVGFAELLQKHAGATLDDKGRHYIQTILDASKRMGDLIDDLLAFSRIGRAATSRTLVNLDQLVAEAVTEIRQDTAGRDIALKIGPLPVCSGDRSMLKLVVSNLISNAVKFTRLRSQAKIEIGCADGREGEVEVFVRDNGAGFDMQYVDKLFGVFQRLHLPEEFEGTGIGLAIVQRIVHRHGGKVRAEGAVDEGATFYFSLPKAHDAAERAMGAS